MMPSAGRLRAFSSARALDPGMDYAFPSPYGYPTFARENNNRPIDRQPLNPPSDLGGQPTQFPLY